MCPDPVATDRFGSDLSGPEKSKIAVYCSMCELKYRGLVTVCGLSFGDFIFLEALSLFSDHHGEFHGRPRSDTVEPSPVRVI